MDFTFATVEVRTLCEVRRKALQVMGATAAHALSQRLADLEACTTVGEFFELFEAEVSSADRDTVTLQVLDGWALSFRSAHLKLPLTDMGGVDWQRVTRVMILAVSRSNA